MRRSFSVAFLAVLVSSVLVLATTRARGEATAPARLAADAWLNVPEGAAPELRGAVTLVEFWTFACWNCRNVEPHVREWQVTYGPKGLRVIGVHTPELEHERPIENVRQYLLEKKIDWPVAIDGAFRVWKAFGVEAWPTWFLVDRDGRIRFSHVGEGGYDETARKIEELLAER